MSLWILWVGILRSARLLVVGVWMMPRIPAVMIMGGRTCQPCWVSSWRSTVYFSSFLVEASKGNLSLHYVSSKNWTFRYGFGEDGGLAIDVAIRMHSILGWSLCKALATWKVARAWGSHDDMVFSSIHLLSLPSFMSVQHLVVGSANRVLAICVDCFCYVG